MPGTAELDADDVIDLADKKNWYGGLFERRLLINNAYSLLDRRGDQAQCQLIHEL